MSDLAKTTKALTELSQHIQFPGSGFRKCDDPSITQIWCKTELGKCSRRCRHNLGRTAIISDNMYKLLAYFVLRILAYEGTTIGMAIDG